MQLDPFLENKTLVLFFLQIALSEKKENYFKIPDINLNYNIF